MLAFSLITENHQKELQAYDLIGLSWYYQGKLEKAQFFHERSLKGEIEPKDSYLRDQFTKEYNYE